VKSLLLKVSNNGTTWANMGSILFENENDSCLLTVDYSETHYQDWNKRVEFNIKGASYFEESDSILLSSQYLQEGMLSIQPTAYLGEKKVKFNTLKIYIKKSLNVIENDESITPSIAEQLMNQLDDILRRLEDLE
jgi:hypothetical protein